MGRTHSFGAAGAVALAFASAACAAPVAVSPGAAPVTAGATSSSSTTASATPPATPRAAAQARLAIVLRDATSLRAAPHATAQQQALLWQGEVLEVRGERLDHLQVWDHRRERGGFVEAARVRVLTGSGGEANDLLAVLRFVRGTPGQEALGIGLAAAWLKAAPAEAVAGAAGAEAFDAIGTLAERLAQRASATPAASPPSMLTTPISISTSTLPMPSRADAALAAHLEVVARYGVAFASFERAGTMRICYEGEAFRRVLAMPAADPAQRARAALGLTQPECIDPALPVIVRQQLETGRADVLDRVDLSGLSQPWQARVSMRRAGVWSGLAFEHARRSETAPAQAAARRALAELARIDRTELADDDVPGWNEAALRVGASRWAAVPVSLPVAMQSLQLAAVAGEPGQTCIALNDAREPAAREPLARRCTWGVAWLASASVNREGNAVAIAVQPLAGWRELWVFSRSAQGAWSAQVLPPSTATPELGYAEFAGWVPGGRQMLVAREARGSSGLRRTFEVVRLDTLGTERQAADPAVLGPFMRWQDARWKTETVSLR